MYLGIDLGTSSLKILLADENGKPVDGARAEYPVSCPRAGWSEQSPDDWYDALLAAVKELGARRDLQAVRAVGFCGQMHGLVALDKGGKAIRPAILWNDGRAAEECEYLNETVGKDKLLKWTGNIAYPGFTAPKILWLKKHEPERFKRISKIMLPKDYLVWKMSGVFAGDASDNSGTLYFDVKNKKWSAEMLDIMGVESGQLPKIFESYEAVGKIAPAFARETRLNPNALVAAGGGDQAVGAVGTGTVGEGALSVSLGTSGVVFAGLDAFKAADGGLHSFCHADGKYHLMGCMLSCAASVDFWLKNILRTKDFAADVAAIGGAKADGLYFLPYLAGERSPINDPGAKGAFYGLTLSHTRADMTRAVVEGVCLGLKDCYEAMKKSGVRAKFAGVIGGGAKSPEWLQILAGCLGLEIRTVGAGEGGGLGAAILAMVADGAYENVEKACGALIAYDKSYFPTRSETDCYDRKYAAYKTLGGVKTG
ncbi:MAG: xylulokinase [Clostridiales bacterium]|jgi:xylulokinase|nr:xylulokinase [Clostridiales bacterium]